MQLEEVLKVLEKEDFKVITKPYISVTNSDMPTFEHVAIRGLKKIRFYSGFDDGINKYTGTFTVVNWCQGLTLEEAINICN